MAFNIEDFPTSISAQRMLSMVTQGFYDRSYVGKWLYQVMGLEMDEIAHIVDDLYLQIFPETATWGLSYHEIKWQLPVRENLPYEERRRLIYLKRDFKAPMTPSLMERYIVKAFPDCEARIEDIHDHGAYGWSPDHPNIFRAYFIIRDDYEPKLAAVRELLNQIKQSHTTYGLSLVVRGEIDQSKLEKIAVPFIRFPMAVDFWRMEDYRHDGSYLHDGTIIHGSGRRAYWMGITLHAVGSKVITRETATAGMKYTAEARHTEKAKCLASGFASAIRTKQSVSAAVQINTAAQLEETVNGTLLIRTPVVARHNGEIRHNGAVRHKSIYKEVEL